MTKIELVAKAAEKAEVSKKIAEKVINAFLETVEEAVKAGEEVRIVDLVLFRW
jgi:DNA-binding protein HU-beta